VTVRRGDPCTICGKPVVGRGWCPKHYATWQKYGDPNHQTRRYAAQSATCTHEGGCDQPSHALSLCKVHYKRERTHGETTDPRERRFWAQVDRRGDDECWPWIGYIQPNGYGARSNHAGETRLAHRLVYKALVGPIPEGLVLDHLCHTRDPGCADSNACLHRRCCNPAHLDPISQRENIARGRGGDSWGYVPDPMPVKPKVEKPLTCTEDDGTCGNEIYKRTICRKHYRRWLRDPAVERPSQRTPEQRFWMKVDKNGPLPEANPELGRCWIWTASINPGTGYGQFGLSHGNMIGAHRFAFELENGPAPGGFDVHHKCLRRSCVRHDHLAAVSRSENLRMRANRRT